MLFNSYTFILGFLPITVFGYFVLGAVDRRAAKLFLLAASLFFYGWWSVPYLGLLLVSIAVNYALGRAILVARAKRPRLAAWLVGLGVSANVGLLTWYKYSVFIVGNVAAVTGLDLAMETVVLPLAISFYTFQQIAYLVDCRRPGAKGDGYGFVDYALFVSFFPQLIAGPIVHHGDIVPQFRNPAVYSPRFADISVGLLFLGVGLAKKLLIADTVGSLSDPVFDRALTQPPTPFEAWEAVAAFSLGLYFDFSGYSDMAVGLARMFGIRIAYNFNSPYQATSIIDFWKRWHITLSTWLRDFLYIPLGGSRNGPVRRYANLMITMLVGGLWHGASWTFVVWGGLHGLYLMINHGWRAVSERVVIAGRPLRMPPLAGWALTMMAVAFAWIFFRAPTFEHAAVILQSMAGLTPDLASGLAAARVDGAAAAPADLSLTERVLVASWTLEGLYPHLVLLVAAGIALFLPNSQEIVDRVARSRAALPRLRLPRFRPSTAWAAAASVLLLVSLNRMSEVKAFVYFQF